MRKFPDLPHKELAVLDSLDSPAAVQGFLNAMPQNFEERGETCRSVLTSLRRNESHCMEGALIAAAAFWRHGRRPFLLDLKTTDDDVDHVVALFRDGGRWGAVSKTNHSVLRYRDAVYKTPRELAMSYFNEYFLDDGRKTLRSFAGPFDLLEYDEGWLVSRANLWQLRADLDHAPHIGLLTEAAAERLRLAEPIEIEAGKIVEWRRPWR